MWRGSGQRAQSIPDLARQNMLAARAVPLVAAYPSNMSSNLARISAIAARSFWTHAGRVGGAGGAAKATLFVECDSQDVRDWPTVAEHKNEKHIPQYVSLQ